MPTILRWNGLRIVIDTNDRLEAVYVLNCPDGPPELRESFGFRIAELNDLVGVLGDEIDALCDEWERIHDH